jgi:ribosomal protein S18 acetylase RimI-like enzyme
MCKNKFFPGLITIRAIDYFAHRRIMTEAISIRIALPEDASVVCEIGRFTFYETWRKVNTEEDMQLYLAEAFAEKKIKGDLENASANIFLLAYHRQEAIGYVKMRRDRTYGEFKNEKAIEIERIYVKEEFQKKKIGKLLMDQCIEIAKAENNKWLWLGVNNENKKAMNFYKNYGFEIFGTKKFKLGNAEDEDFLMKLSLSSSDKN